MRYLPIPKYTYTGQYLRIVHVVRYIPLHKMLNIAVIERLFESFILGTIEPSLEL
jgi:hypothetical protein